MMQLIDTGADHITLFGSRLFKNDQFLFVSGNGYNIYNGLVKVYHNNFTTNEDRSIEKYIHSIIKSPYSFNLNFGTSLYATNELLFVGGISYDIYQGIIFIYKYKYNRWLHMQTLTSSYSKNLLGFGNYIFINNDNILNIGTFYGDIHRYSYDNYNDKFILQNIIFYNNLDVDNIILCDEYNNIILWHSSLFQIFNTKSQIWIEINNLSNCFKIESKYDKLYTSCDNKFVIYDIIYDTEQNIENIKIYQIINNEDYFFAIDFYISDNTLLITGSNNIYQYTLINNLWELKETYTVQNDISINSFTIEKINNYIIVGNYELDDLRGGLWSYRVIENIYNNSVSNIDNISNNNFLLNRIGLSILLLLFGGLLTIFFTLLCYYCVKLFTPKLDEKKKEKEEDSPYKVYSYAGYVETDDAPPIIYPANQTPYYFYYPTTPTILNSYNIPIDSETNNAKNNDSKNNDAKNNVEHVSSKEKVASYKGYTYDYILNQYNEKIHPTLKELREKNKK